MSFNLTIGPRNLLPSEWAMGDASVYFTTSSLALSDGLIFVTLNCSNPDVTAGVALDLAEDANLFFLAIPA
jgi:hypothetical protein